MVTAMSMATADSCHGGNATAEAVAIGKIGGGAEATAPAKAEGEENATARAYVLSDGANRRAKSVANAIASESGDASTTSIAQGVGEGFDDAVAVAVDNSVDNGLNDKAATALADACVFSLDEGPGDSYATALALGLASDDQTRDAYALAVSTVLKAVGCDVLRSTLTNAQAVAVANDNERQFADAVDFDIQVSECLYDTRPEDHRQWGAVGVEKCGGIIDVCAYSSRKSTLHSIWISAEADSTCLSPCCLISSRSVPLISLLFFIKVLSI